MENHKFKKEYDGCLNTVSTRNGNQNIDMFKETLKYP